MKMKEVVKQTGLTERTVRFYVEQELIHPKVELVNGREYRTYSEQDIAELKVIADLRKAFFSLEEIKRMQLEPASIQEIVEDYKARQIADAAAKSALVSALEGAGSRDLSSVAALAARLGKVAAELPLPKRDVEPNFGRFDGTSKLEREMAYDQFLLKQERQIKIGKITVISICWFMIVQSLVGLFLKFDLGGVISLLLCVIFSIALYSGVVWVRYFLALLAALNLLLSLAASFHISEGIYTWLLVIFFINLFINGFSAAVLIKNRAVSEFLYSQKNG